MNAGCWLRPPSWHSGRTTLCRRSSEVRSPTHDRLHLAFCVILLISRNYWPLILYLPLELGCLYLASSEQGFGSRRKCVHIQVVYLQTDPSILLFLQRLAMGCINIIKRVLQLCTLLSACYQTLMLMGTSKTWSFEQCSWHYWIFCLRWNTMWPLAAYSRCVSIELVNLLLFCLFPSNREA